MRAYGRPGRTARRGRQGRQARPGWPGVVADALFDRRRRRLGVHPVLRPAAGRPRPHAAEHRSRVRRDRLVGAGTAPLWSHLADTRLGAARVLIVSSAATALFALALAVSGSAFWAILLVAVLMSMCSSPGAPLSDALAVAYLGEERMSEYGRIRLWASLGWGVAVIGFGALYEAVGLAPVLPLYAAGTVAFGLWTLRLPPGAPLPVRAESRFGALGDVFRCFARLGVVRDRHGDRERGDLCGAGLREPAHRGHRRRSVPRRPGGRPRRPDRDPGDALERRPRPALRPAVGVRRGCAGLRPRVSVLELHGLAAGAGAGGHRRRRGLRAHCTSASW